MNNISIQLPRETLLEILKQIPYDELLVINRELRELTNPLQQQLARAQARVKPFSLKDSTFFALPPVDMGETSAKDIDRMVAEDAYRKD